MMKTTVTSLVLLALLSLAAPASAQALEWQLLNNGEPLLWHEAVAAANDLREKTGAPWRLPNIREVFTRYVSINETLALNAGMEHPLWTGNTFAGHNTAAVVLTQNGQISYQPKLTPARAWAVQGGYYPPTLYGLPHPPESPHSFWPPTGRGASQSIQTFKGRESRDWRRPRPTEFQEVDRDAAMPSRDRTVSATTNQANLESGQYRSFVHGDEGWWQPGHRRRFKVLSDTLIVDPVTGLTWYFSPSRVVLSRNEAEAYCRDLDVNGSQAWDLPDLDELLSLVSYGHVVPACYPELPLKPGLHWSATTSPDGDRGWAVEFGHGRTELLPQRTRATVIAVNRTRSLSVNQKEKQP